MELVSQIIYVPEDPFHPILKMTRMASFSGLPMRLSSKNRLEFQEVLGVCVCRGWSGCFFPTLLLVASQDVHFSSEVIAPHGGCL